MRGQITEVCLTAIAMMGMWVMDKNAAVRIVLERCTLKALFTHNEIQPDIFTLKYRSVIQFNIESMPMG